MPEQMDLRIRILARGAQALRSLDMIRRRTARLVGGIAKVGQIGARSFRVLARSIGFVLRPTRLLGLALAGLVGAAAFLGTQALTSAGDMEALRQRLEGVTATTAQANRAFRETMQLAVASPFEGDELVEGKIRLLNLGVTGKKAMLSLMDAATITAKPVADLAQILASMETEPLRAMGVGLKRSGESFEFTFRDKMQKVKAITASGVDAARKSLLSIFDIKFGGASAKFASAWKGLTSTLRFNVKLGLSKFGEGMFPAAKKFVSGINAKLSDLIESGRLEKWGARVGATLQNVWDRGQAMFEYAKGVLKSLNNQSGNAWADSLKIVLVAGGEILAVSFVNYLRTAGNIFGGIGRILGASIKGEILQLRGFGGARKRAATKSLDTLTDDQIGQLAGSSGIDAGKLGAARSDAKSLKSATGAFERSAIGSQVKRFINRLSKEQQAALATVNKGQDLVKGVEQFKRGLIDVQKENFAAVSNILKTAEKKISAASGFEGPSVAENLARIQSERAASSRELVTATRTVLRPIDGNKLQRERVRQTRTFEAEKGAYQKGQGTGGGGVVINVETLTIKADDTKKMQNKIIAGAGLARMPVAATA